MNKIGIHYGAFITSWLDDQLPLVSKVHELGFDVFELGAAYVTNISEKKRTELRSAAEHYGIDLTLSMGLQKHQDIGSADTEIRKAGYDYLVETAKAMRLTGISDCSGIIYGAWNNKISSYDEKKIYWEHSVNTMKEASKVFADQGVFFNVEVVNRFESFLINSCKEANAYLDQVDSKNLGIHLDTFHMNIEEDSLVSPFFEAGSRLRYLHVGENNRKMPGLGMLPWKSICEAIKHAGYLGPISIETFVVPGGEVGSAVSLYRELMDPGTVESQLKRSLSFVKNLLET